MRRYRITLIAVAAALTLVGTIAGSAAANRTAVAVAVVSPTTTTVTSSRNPSVRGESLTLTATVLKSGTTIPATGLVTFSVDGATIMPGVPLLAGVATATVASLPLGSHTISVTYGGSGATYLGSSGSLTQTINKANATVTVTSTANPAVYGQELVLTATVKPVRPGGGTPSGPVDWTVGSVPASGTLSNGKVGLRLPLAAGSYPVTATYNGDANFNSASTGPFTQTVSKAATTLTLGSSQNPSLYNEPPRITVTVTPVSPGAGTPTGNVPIEVTGKPSYTLNVTLADGKATYTFANHTPGSAAIDAEYTGDANFAGSDADTLVQNVGRARLPALTGDFPARPVVLGSPLSLAFTLTPPAGVGARTPTGSVTLNPFDATGSVTATLSKTGAAMFATTAGANASGSYATTYTGDANYSGGTYPPFKVDFKNGSTAVSVSASPSAATAGDAVKLTAIVRGIDIDLDTEAGTVTFTDGGRALGQPVTLAGGKAGLVVKALDPGKHTFRAEFSGVRNVEGSEDAIDVVVTPTDVSPAKAGDTAPATAPDTTPPTKGAVAPVKSEAKAAANPAKSSTKTGAAPAGKAVAKNGKKAPVTAATKPTAKTTKSSAKPATPVKPVTPPRRPPAIRPAAVRPRSPSTSRRDSSAGRST